MIRLRVLGQVTLLTFREFIRTPGAVFWTYGFPLTMAVCLGLAFRTSEPAPLAIAVVESEHVAAQFEALEKNERLQPQLFDLAGARDAFSHGRCLLIVSGTAQRPVITVDPTRPESELARLHVVQSLQASHSPQSVLEVEERDETAPGSRYIDWLIPGLISLNLLGAGLWGVGFNLVQMRVKHILRRLMVTPMRRSEFMLAFLLSRLLLVIPESAIILGFGVWIFDTPISGSLGTILVLVLLGAVSFTGLGILIACRAKSMESVSGLMNFVMIPMWLLGGSFFSSDRFPDVLQPLVQILPITHLNNGLRAVIQDGAEIGTMGLELGYLAAFGVLTMVLAIKIFRWT